MRQKFRATIQEFKMLERGDRVVLGVSGGPDSMAMLVLFQEIMDEWQLKLQIVHLNHGFRGQEADADEAYVKMYCDQQGLPCRIFKRNILQESQEKGLSFEEAGRLARYEVFEQVMRETGSCRIAVAHNQNDQAETVLMRLIRGSGLDGLAAIPPVRDVIIRPLIHISRQEIEAYCNEVDLKPRTDHTNAEDIYHRNSIRLTLIPLIEKLYNPSIVKRLGATADIIRDENAYMDQIADQTVAELRITEVLSGSGNQCQAANRFCFSSEAFNQHPIAIRRRVVRKVVQVVGGSIKNLSYDQVDTLIEMLKKGRHGNLKELNGVVFSIGYGIVTAGLNDERYMPAVEAYEVVVKIIDKSEWLGDKSGIYTVWMDYASICGELHVRYRQDGDRFTPFGMVGSKKLKDFMIDEKIPQAERHHIPLLCDDQGILWVYGHRAASRCKVNSETQKVAKIELRLKKDLSC